MKSTTSRVIASKIEKLVADKHLNRNSTIFDWLMLVSLGAKHLRPVNSTGGSWKYSSLSDRTVEITSALKSLGVEFTLSNDAPKGGKTGALITITTKVKQV
jgi:hypothetical protein